MPFLKLISLECLETEDYTGSDEVYIRINGRRMKGKTKKGRAIIDPGIQKLLDGLIRTAC
jgi:hypothetical protein